MMVKRLALLILCFCLLCTPVRAAENEKLVALTFDDGPSGKFTRKLLEGLEERGAKATFLLCGYRMEQYPDLTQRIFQEGHEIGLHGYSHKSMRDMRRWDTAQEIRKAMALLPEGCEASFLRPPGGLCSECIQTVAEEFGLSLLHWSVDPKDWAVHDAKSIEAAVIGHVQDGDVILLHDMSDSSVEAALEIIDVLQGQGFRFVTVSELAQARNIVLVPGTKYTRFGSADFQKRK
jgi:peptidoglycan/xylan/chitin deacetylase (PgdA/CDA1 family)